jgi:hypothetical protein
MSRPPNQQLPSGINLKASTKAEIIWACFDEDNNGVKKCLLLDPSNKDCSVTYAKSTKSTNLGLHITSKHSHYTMIVDALNALNDETSTKKRARDEMKVVELPSKVVKVNKLSNDVAISKQSVIEDYVTVDGSSLRSELNEAIALMISVHSLPMQLVESPYFHKVLELYRKSAKHVKKVDSRQAIIKSELELFKSIQHTVNQSLKSSAYPITLAFDGWTNTNHLHVQNIMALSSSSTVLLKSDLTTDRATAESLFPFIDTVISELIDNKIEIGGIVADNASVNGKIARMIRKKYPWILRLPCASHTLQLCIIRFFDQDAVADNIKLIVRQVVKAISGSHVRLNEFLRVQGADAVHLKKPQKTRWSSYHRACKSLSNLKPYVELALRRNATDGDHPILQQLTADFWDQLADLVAFLDPFSYASDIIQSDHASLLDVHTQFSTLNKACTEAPLSLTHGAGVMQVAINKHWQKNINQEAVYMAAHFAYEQSNSNLFSDAVKVDASDWFYGWTAELWYHHESLPATSPLPSNQKSARIHEIRALIEVQHNNFLTNQFPYARVRAQIEANRSTSVSDPRVPQPKFIAFDALTPWLRLDALKLSNGKELVHGVVTLLSMNCSEASVERGFSLQKLTHSLLMNKKLPTTVERQCYIKTNHRVTRQNKPNHRVSMRSTSLSDDDEIDPGLAEYGSDTDVEIFESSDDRDDSADDDSDVPNSEDEDDNQSSSINHAVRSRPSPSPAVRINRPANARSIWSAAPLAPPRRAWTIVDGLTEDLNLFCQAYIATNQLQLPSPFANRGAAKLRAAMEADPSVVREQPSDAQRHIIFLLQTMHAPAAPPE